MYFNRDYDTWKTTEPEMTAEQREEWQDQIYHDLDRALNNVFDDSEGEMLHRNKVAELVEQVEESHRPSADELINEYISDLKESMEDADWYENLRNKELLSFLEDQLWGGVEI